MKIFENFVPFKDEEFKVFDRVCEIIREVKQIPCKKCNYCKEVCPSDVSVSKIFSVYNKFLCVKITKDNLKEKIAGKGIEKCIKCGKCETNCPQNIKIREELESIERIMK